MFKMMLDSMRTKNYGRIINISSVVEQTENCGQANYAAKIPRKPPVTRTFTTSPSLYV
jgi:NADP-dependent 3-hydroxy acid dehydrogenase YdfG